MITLIILTLLALFVEILLFFAVVCICLIPIIGLFKFIEWLIDR